MRGMGVIGVVGGRRGVRAVLRHKKQDLWYIIGYFTLAEARADIDSSGTCLFQNPNTKYAVLGGIGAVGVVRPGVSRVFWGEGSMRGIRIYRFLARGEHGKWICGGLVCLFVPDPLTNIRI
jgi:hypothetical protein